MKLRYVERPVHACRAGSSRPAITPPASQGGVFVSALSRALNCGMASARLRQITRRYERQREEMRQVIGAFLVEFAAFESMSLTEVLKALSSDDVLVEHLPELMDLYQRLKLMKQLGVARRLPAPLKEDIGHVRKVAHALLECRNDIAHGRATLSGVGTPEAIERGAPLTPVVMRRRSERRLPKFSDADLQSMERVRAKIQREWFHDLPTIREWTETATRLQVAASQLARKLERQRSAEDWESVVVARVEIPVRTKKGGGDA